MSFIGEPTRVWAQRRLDTEALQATMQQVHENMLVEMRWSPALQMERANRGRIPAPNLQVGCKVWLEAPNISTTRQTWKLGWKRLGPFQVCRQVCPSADELELPASRRIHRVQPVLLF
jgi:hypothetical protein